MTTDSPFRDISAPPAEPRPDRPRRPDRDAPHRPASEAHPLLAAHGGVLTVGQYLRPSQKHLPLVKYYTPAEFMSLRRIGLEMGFRHVQSGPLVRSSYHAAEQVPGRASVAAV